MEKSQYNMKKKHGRKKRVMNVASRFTTRLPVTHAPEALLSPWQAGPQLPTHKRVLSCTPAPHVVLQVHELHEAQACGTAVVYPEQII